MVWRTALVANTTEFGGKIIWGGAADDQNAYFGLGTGGVAAVQLKDGERQWFTAMPPAPAGLAQHRAGRSGDRDPGRGFLRRMGRRCSERCPPRLGRVLWEYNTVQDFKTVNGVAAKGGSMGAAGPVVAGGMLFVPSGYIGVKNGMPGNVLLAFSVSPE